MEGRGCPKCLFSLLTNCSTGVGLFLSWNPLAHKQVLIVQQGEHRLLIRILLSGSEGSSATWPSFLVSNYSRVYKQEHEVCFFPLSLSFILLHTYSKYLAPCDLIGIAVSAKSNEKRKSKAPLPSQLACLAADGSSLNSGCCRHQVPVSRRAVYLCACPCLHVLRGAGPLWRGKECTNTFTAGGCDQYATLFLWRGIKASAGRPDWTEESFCEMQTSGVRAGSLWFERTLLLALQSLPFKVLGAECTTLGVWQDDSHYGENPFHM